MGSLQLIPAATRWFAPVLLFILVIRTFPKVTLPCKANIDSTFLLLETPLAKISRTTLIFFSFLFLFSRTVYMINSYFMFTSLYYSDCLDFQHFSISEAEWQMNSAIVIQQWCFDCPSRRNFILGNHCAVTDEIPHSKVNKTTNNCIKSFLR